MSPAYIHPPLTPPPPLTPNRCIVLMSSPVVVEILGHSGMDFLVSFSCGILPLNKCEAQLRAICQSWLMQNATRIFQ